MSEHQPGPVVKVARDLSAIEDMAGRLLTQAVHAANDRTMPGGDAVVQLAHVANLREWQARLDDAEQAALDDPDLHPWPDVSHEDDTAEPWTATVLQTLWYWSDDIRETNAQPLDGRRATIASEARIIRHYLDQLWATLPEWSDFADDIEGARRQLENLLREGERAELGVPCMYDQCRGARLTRKLQPTRGENGEKVWVVGNWLCPRCKRTWSADQYARMVTAAHEAAKIEEIHGQTWCTLEYAARTVKRPESTIRVWVHREELPTVCIISGRRVRFVLLDLVRQLDQEKSRRTSAA